MLVVSRLACPSQLRITVTSTSAVTRLTAAAWRNACGEIKHRKNERGFPSLADPGSQERCHGIADSGPSGMPSSGRHLPVRMGVFRVFLGAHKLGFDMAKDVGS